MDLSEITCFKHIHLPLQDEPFFERLKRFFTGREVDAGSAQSESFIHGGRYGTLGKNPEAKNGADLATTSQGFMK